MKPLPTFLFLFFPDFPRFLPPLYFRRNETLAELEKEYDYMPQSEDDEVHETVHRRPQIIHETINRPNMINEGSVGANVTY